MLWLIELHGHIEREEEENFSPLICWWEPSPYFFRVSCYGDLAQGFVTPSPWQPVDQKDPNSVRQHCFPSGLLYFPSLLSFCVWSANLLRAFLWEKTLGLESFLKVNDATTMTINTEILQTWTPIKPFCLQMAPSMNNLSELLAFRWGRRLKRTRPDSRPIVHTVRSNVCGHLSITRMCRSSLKSWKHAVV